MYAFGGQGGSEAETGGRRQDARGAKQKTRSKDLTQSAQRKAEDTEKGGIYRRDAERAEKGKGGWA